MGRQTLKFQYPNMTGPDVAYLQKFLVDGGYLTEATGKYDAATVEAVRKFQENNGLVVDGVVGSRETWPVIEAGWEDEATAAAAPPETPSPAAGAADTPRERDLHPELLKRWRRARDLWNQKHPDRPAFITCSYRSKEEQARLYAQGRTTPGQIVTNAKPGKSVHNYRPACAFDVAFRKGSALDWDERLFKEFARLAKAQGLEWGGDWRSFTDMPHFQAPGYTWRDGAAGREPKFA